MTLQPGQMLAHYRIVEKIGSGGMGEVWSAEDTRLKRTVALKVLPPRTNEDPHLRARFEREAQAVAALNHPNIVTIHAVEDADGILFLAMELVEGESLSGWTKTAMPLEKIFALAIPLADAVGAAHDAGILHRDLKPDNIMVTADGVVKVLDFGLAKLRDQVVEQPAGGSDDNLTREGKIVGTAAYMSPEQAEGKAVGPESDVFALGIILYQMATGQRPFSGGTTISMISSILKEEPEPVTQINRALPRHLGRIVRRCLAKDPKRRYATARGLRNELELLQGEPAGGAGEATEASGAGALRVALRITAGALVLMAGVALVGWLGRSGGEATGAPGARVSQQTFYAGVETEPSLSPDGQFLAYAASPGLGSSDIFLLRVDGSKPINLTADSESFDGQPAFSPDGTQIVFRSDRNRGGLYVMGATGEATRRLTDGGYNPAWSPDGKQVVYATEGFDTPLERYDRSTLRVVDVETGATREIFGRDAVQPSWSPGGRRIAFWTVGLEESGGGQRDIVTIRPDESDLVMVTDDVPVDWRPVWSADGRHLYFASDRGGSMNLWRVPVDEQSGETLGEIEPVTMPSLWSGPFAISGDGARLAYVARDDRSRLIGVAFDPAKGAVTGDPTIVSEGALLVATWDVSPDGEWIALANTGRQEDLYLVRPDGSGMRKLTDDLHKDRGVSWFDDERLVFYSARSGSYETWTIRRDGSDLQAITETTGEAMFQPRISRDGTRLALHDYDATYIFELNGPRPLRKEGALRIDAGAETGGTFRGEHWSPDGMRLLGEAGPPLSPTAAFFDLRDDSLHIVPPPADATSKAGGWLPDGRRFVATAAGRAWVVDAESGAWKELPLRTERGTAQITLDGRMLHYMETTSQADIWVAQLD